MTFQSDNAVIFFRDSGNMSCSSESTLSAHTQVMVAPGKFITPLGSEPVWQLFVPFRVRVSA